MHAAVRPALRAAAASLLRAFHRRLAPPTATRPSSPIICRLPDNPLADFVELPPTYSELRYSSLLCGVIRGALEMVSVRVDCRFIRDVLNGDDTTEMRVTVKEVMADVAGSDYKDD